MNIITLMDFRKEPYITMCKAWVYLAKRFNPHARIFIGHYNNIPDIKQFAKRYDDISFMQISPDSIQSIHIDKGFVHHPDQELQLALLKELQVRQITKFIYVDADAFILDTLDSWWDVISNKPCIAMLQQYENNMPIYNMGVFSYCNTKQFLSFDTLYQQYTHDGEVLIHRGAQGIINSYFRKIAYSPTHTAIGFEYNCFTKNCIVQQVDDEHITVFSGNHSRFLSLYNKLTNTPEEWWENWIWWNKYKKVKILHGYGDQFKFWMLPECRKLWEYCKKQVVNPL